MGIRHPRQERKNATEVEARSEHSQISNAEEDGAAGQEGGQERKGARYRPEVLQRKGQYFLNLAFLQASRISTRVSPRVLSTFLYDDLGALSNELGVFLPYSLLFPRLCYNKLSFSLHRIPRFFPRQPVASCTLISAPCWNILSDTTKIWVWSQYILTSRRHACASVCVTHLQEEGDMSHICRKKAILLFICISGGGRLYIGIRNLLCAERGTAGGLTWQLWHFFW